MQQPALLRSGLTMVWTGQRNLSPLPSQELLASVFPTSAEVTVGFDERGLFATSGEASPEGGFFMEIVVNHDRCEIGGTDFEVCCYAVGVLSEAFKSAVQGDSGPQVFFGFNAAYELGDLPKPSGQWLGDRFLRPGLSHFPADQILECPSIQLKFGLGDPMGLPIIRCTVEPRAGKPSALFAAVTVVNQPEHEWPSQEKLIGLFKDFAFEKAPAGLATHLDLT